MKFGMVFLIGLISLFSTVSAQPDGVQTLETEQFRLVSQQDSLLEARAALIQRLDSLSVRADRLKGLNRAEAASGDLQQVLQRSMNLVEALEGVDRHLETVRADLAEAKARLMSVYDLEIGALISGLGAGNDSDVITRLTVLQRAREALSTPVAEPGREVVPLAMREEDGPDEIRQKADLMEDMAERLGADALDLKQQMKRLEEERRLRARVSAFSREMDLFDETAAEGRALVPGAASKGEAGLSGDGSAVSDAERVSAGLVPGDAAQKIEVGREVSPEGARLSLSSPGGDDLEQEIRRLKQRQEEVKAHQEALRGQAKAFRQRLEQMLEDAH